MNHLPALAPGPSWKSHLSKWKATGGSAPVVSADASNNELLLYGVVGGDGWTDEPGITDTAVASALASLSGAKTITVRINSPGGDVSQGFSIYNLLSQSKARVEAIVDGWALSAASVILMAADRRVVSENSSIMIHNAWTMTAGNKIDLRKTADLLELLDRQITATYVRRTGQSQSRIEEWMAAETWFTGQAAITSGFADSLIPLKGKTSNSAKSAFSETENLRQRLELLRLQF